MMRSRFVLMLAVLVAGPSSALARPLVVLDPGHGGPEIGARSPVGVHEKDVVLSISQLTADVLRDKGFRVRLTRTEDKNIAFGARVGIANSRKAAVFVSIHANSAPVRSRRGIECYILSAEASDKRTAALLAKEEGHAAHQSADQNDTGDHLSGILFDLAQTQAHADSARLARRLQDSLGRLAGLKPSRGLRQAPFAVLKGARMPAVLVELGYLSNPEQARFLSSRKGQKRVAERLASGISSYLARRRHR